MAEMPQKRGEGTICSLLFCWLYLSFLRSASSWKARKPEDKQIQETLEIGLLGACVVE